MIGFANPAHAATSLPMDALPNAFDALVLARELVAVGSDAEGVVQSAPVTLIVDRTPPEVVAVAERDGEHYLQISGYHTVNQVSVDRDESTEELEDKAAILSRADEISRFNKFHGLWVYRISETNDR